MREISSVVSIFGVFLLVFFVEKYDTKITYAENDAIVITGKYNIRISIFV